MYKMTVREFLESVARGPYAWPGGYPVFWITNDGAALCWDCARQNRTLIAQSIHQHPHDGWQVVAADANWENPQLYCDHCGARIESAYAED